MKLPTIYEKIPRHLHPFIASQDPSLYTSIDHASWRYIMRISKKFFAEHAHQKYLDGLKETGISAERIPLVSEMDACLQKFGWRAVAVVGFIPPAVFMEFLSLGVLPIACDMRKLEHLAYTPAPDIVHEAAGHAPIIADQEYADFLLEYGEISRKVIFSDQDMNVYEAVRVLSDTKEDPTSTEAQIKSAQKNLDQALTAVDHVSEATELSRMAWWTTEYGLVGDLKAPKIYGAGLLSSISESYHCFQNDVQKIPFTIDCVEMSYDITRPQPQLYVTPDFATLTKVLEKLAARMAYRRGGIEGLKKAIRARTTTTAEFDSGIQVSGTLSEILTDAKGEPCYLKYTGPVQLSFRDMELEGQGATYHSQGYSTPLGRLKGLQKSLADLSREELERYQGQFEFESGVTVCGDLSHVISEQGLNLILVFKNCTVKRDHEILYRPEWGDFDLACGSKVISVFGGAADRGRYLEATGGFQQKPSKQKSNLTDENRGLDVLFARVRKVRESKTVDRGELVAIHSELEKKYPQDWLLRLELLEFQGPWVAPARKRLDELASSSKDLGEIISRGIEAL